MLTIVDPNPCSCKICGNPSPLFGVVDFHKSCIEAQGKILDLSGKPIYYRRCRVCGFAFTREFDDWSTQAFLTHIYNHDYVLVDPDYVAARPTSNAKVVAETFLASRNDLSILDFGGGSGLLAQTLVQNGFHATTYDPFSSLAKRPTGPFNLITCFEVMEHSPFPGQTVSEMNLLLADEGIVLFSTLTQPANFDDLRLHWWYASPRNGHVSLYSRRSLTLLFQQQGLQLVSLSDLLHVAYRKLPAFAAHLVNPADS